MTPFFCRSPVDAAAHFSYVIKFVALWRVHFLLSAVPLIAIFYDYLVGDTSITDWKVKPSVGRFFIK